MRVLLLARNKLGLAAACALCEMVRCSDCDIGFQRLDLKRNGFGDGGMRLFAEALLERATSSGHCVLREVALWPTVNPQECCSERDNSLCGGWPVTGETQIALQAAQGLLLPGRRRGHTPSPSPS